MKEDNADISKYATYHGIFVFPTDPARKATHLAPDWKIDEMLMRFR